MNELEVSIEELEGFGITSDSHLLVHYHVAEFFRIASGASLYVMGESSLDGTYTEIGQLQSFANGEIRQIGILRPSESIVDVLADISIIQEKALLSASLNLPLSVVLACKLTKPQLAILPNLHDLDADRVSVVIGEDGGGLGSYIRPLSGGAVTCIGAIMGAIARSSVSINIGWVATQNLVDTVYPKTRTGGTTLAKELDVPALVDGTKLNEISIGQQNALNDKGYIFIRKHIGRSGSYFNDSFTCTKLDSDFAYIENNRTIDKCQRGVYLALLPSLGSPIYTDPQSGDITPDSAAMLEALGSEPLSDMLGAGDLSGYKVKVDTKQPVLSTSKLEVIIKVIPVGVLREITVKLGFAVNLS